MGERLGGFDPWIGLSGEFNFETLALTSAPLSRFSQVDASGGRAYSRVREPVSESVSLVWSVEALHRVARPPLTGLRAQLVRGFTAKNSATKVLMGLCLFNFVILVIMNGSLPWGLFDAPAGRQAVLAAGGVTGSLALVQPWRLLSAVFVHFSALHWGMNLYALASIGPAFESRFGGARLVLVFATTGVVGFLTSSYLFAWTGPITAGASGALFGLIGSEVGFLAIHRDPPTREVLVQYLIIAIALSLLMPVNNFAHLGGFVAGLAVGVGLARSKT